MKWSRGFPRRSGRRGPAAQPSTSIASTEPEATLVIGRGDDARAKELNNLRLALATFALQVDAFEMQVKEWSTALGGRKA
jgi:hypothetical protein